MHSDDQFEVIVREHYEPLLRFAISLTRSESDAQDLVQHAFYIWATKGHQLRDFSKVKTWLFTTLHRTYLEAQRKKTRFPHHNLEEVAVELPALAPESFHQADYTQVLSALARVDKVYQGAVALFYLEDCSYKEIATILEVPIGTVRSRLARGIAQLREILQAGMPSDHPEVDVEPPAVSAANEPTALPDDALRPPQLSALALAPFQVSWTFSSTARRGTHRGATSHKWVAATLECAGTKAVLTY
jgi:RNA polymerase sigma-70 factor (ECF subfamily)